MITRFLIAIVTAMMVFPSFAGEVVFQREGAIMVANPLPDGSFDPLRGRLVPWKATLKVSFVPRDVAKGAEVQAQIRDVFEKQFAAVHAGGRCYSGKGETRWWNTHVQNELRDRGVPVVSARAVYTCRG